MATEEDRILGSISLDFVNKRIDLFNLHGEPIVLPLSNHGDNVVRFVRSSWGGHIITALGLLLQDKIDSGGEGW